MLSIPLCYHNLHCVCFVSGVEGPSSTQFSPYEAFDLSPNGKQLNVMFLSISLAMLHFRVSRSWPSLALGMIKSKEMGGGVGARVMLGCSSMKT